MSHSSSKEIWGSLALSRIGETDFPSLDDLRTETVRRKPRTLLLVRVVIAAMVLTLIPLFAMPAVAATYTVNSTEDAPDETPGNNVCDTAGSGTTCTLRAAVMEAN